MPTLVPDTDAPDFELADPSGKPIRLSDFRGKQNVVLALLRGLW